MRTITSTIALALIATLLTATAALAWRVDTTPGEVTSIPTVKAERFGPKADPYFRYKITVTGVRLGRSTPGTVCVPDARWATGTTFTVDGTNVAIGRDECAPLEIGTYVGRWSNSSEVAHFAINQIVRRVPDTKIKLRVIGRSGPRTSTRTLGIGCVWSTPWLYSKPFTTQTVKRVSPFTQRIKRWNSGPGGDFGPLWRGYTVGVSCPTFGIAS